MKELELKDIDWSIKKWTLISNLKVNKNTDVEDELSIIYSKINAQLYFCNCSLCDLFHPKKDRPSSVIYREGDSDANICPGCPLNEIGKCCLSSASNWSKFADYVYESDTDPFKAIHYAKEVVKDLKESREWFLNQNK